MLTVFGSSAFIIFFKNCRESRSFVRLCCWGGGWRNCEKSGLFGGAIQHSKIVVIV